MKTKDKIQLTFTGILVLCALVITTLVLRQQFFPREPEPQLRIIENWQQLNMTTFYHSGPVDASVQIVEFFDYQCPFCKKAQPAVQAIREKYPKKISVIYVHFPLSGHQYAFEAAVAAECARKQDKFEVYHGLLFSKQKQLVSLSYDNLAKKAGVANIAVPTFLINGKLITDKYEQVRTDAAKKLAKNNDT